MKKSILLLVLTFISLHTFAQDLINTGTLIQGGVEDGSKLVEAYVKPLNKAIVYGLSNDTYTKIKKEQSRHLLLSIKLGFTAIPGKDWDFDVTKLDLKHFEPKNPDQIRAQTVFGDSLKSITLVSKEKDLLGRPLIEFDTPKGSQKSIMPLPYISGTYRFKYTNLTFNLIPYINIPDSSFKVGMFGAAAQQDLALFISSLQDKSYSISLQGGAAYLYGHSDLDIKPGKIYSPINISGHQVGPYDNQEINIAYLSLSFNAYFSYDLNQHISVFGGAGINMGSSHIMVQGNYPVYVADPTGTGAVVAQDVKDPLDINNNFNREKLEFGVRGDWNHFFIQAGYNAATYGGLSFNLGYKML